MIDTFTHTVSPEVTAFLTRFHSDSITQHCPSNDTPFKQAP